MTKPIPGGYRSVNVVLTVDDAAKEGTLSIRIGVGPERRRETLKRARAASHCLAGQPQLAEPETREPALEVLDADRADVPRGVEARLAPAAVRLREDEVLLVWRAHQQIALGHAL